MGRWSSVLAHVLFLCLHWIERLSALRQSQRDSANINSVKDFLCVSLLQQIFQLRQHLSLERRRRKETYLYWGGGVYKTYFTLQLGSGLSGSLLVACGSQTGTRSFPKQMKAEATWEQVCSISPPSLKIRFQQRKELFLPIACISVPMTCISVPLSHIPALVAFIQHIFQDKGDGSVSKYLTLLSLKPQNPHKKLLMVAHTYNPRAGRQRYEDLWDSASLSELVSPRQVRNPVSKNKVESDQR